MGRLSSLFARRYLSSRKSLSVINIISKVSIFAVGVPVAAMVVLMSVFNGFEGLVQRMYSDFDPDILVTPARGKVFDAGDAEGKKLHEIKGVAGISFYLEESVLLEYRGRQTLGVLRGVDPMYENVVPVRSLISGGKYELRFGDMEQAVVGQGIAYDLGVRTAFYDPINIYSPRRGEYSSLLPIESYSTGRVFPAGIFRLDAETDGTYVFSTLDFARETFDYEGKASAVAVKLDGNANPDAVRKAIERELGDGFHVATRYEQKETMYRMMKYEKWAIFFITVLVLIIASFSIIGSLVMLIIDKRPDIRTLITMGADIRFTRRIFTDEGMLIGVLGTVLGVAVGVLLCWLQQQFGFVKMGGTFLVPSYPVAMRWEDIVIIIAATLAVNWIITKFTVSRMIPKSSIKL